MVPPASSVPSVLLVVHALPPAERSGTPLAASGYARALGRAGWQVTVLSAAPGAPGWSEAQAWREPGEDFDRIAVPPDHGAGTSWLEAWSVPPATPSAGEPGPAGDVARLLHRLRPDVVHVVDNVFLPLAIAEVAGRMGIPVVRGVSCAEDLCALVVPVSPCSGPAGFCQAPLTVAHCAECVSAATTDDLLAPWRATGEPDADAGRRAQLTGLLAAQRARAARQFSGVYDRVVFASDQFRRYFEQTLPLDPLRTRVVPMGVDVEAGARAAAAAGGTAPRHRSGEEPLTFLVAGNTNPFKGTGAVVAAFTHAALAGRDDWCLLLAGGGNRALYGPLLHDARVHDHGPYDDDQLGALLSAADVGISASVFETFHRVTREYLAAGLPVVGSGAFGISDAVVEGGNGLRFDHAEPDSLRRALVRLLDDRPLVARLAAGARASVVRSVDDEVADLVAIYEEVVAERRTGSGGGRGAAAGA